ncbi:MAG: aminotransferase class V-fold PLP-dependent enzyme [Bifidobacteriaceae bacterium]|jgi:cysteine desulfurase/selenocysteine lyase|nr:aminotransferase class V-fold PLP-dependent enzyme [Bifidobacteriaceae bacterium]
MTKSSMQNSLFATSVFNSSFPESDIEYNGRKLIYLDTAASALKPKSVIELESLFNISSYANISRGISSLSTKATELYEQARQNTLNLITSKPDDAALIITSGATQSLNLAANYYSNKLKKDDEIIISIAEHHSNLLPWKALADKTGAALKIANVDDNGRITVDSVIDKISKNTKVAALAHISNVTGAIAPLKKISEAVHKVGADLIVDAAQSVGHIEVDLFDIDCEMAAFSAHKVYGPTGLGFLYCKKELLPNFPNFIVGGGTVDDVYFEKTNNNSNSLEVVYKNGIAHLEAGTPPISQMIAFGEIVNKLNKTSFETIENYESKIAEKLLEVQNINGIKIIGPKALDNRIGIISFFHESVHPHDLGQFLDDLSIVCRVGHNCAAPIHKRFGANASVRFSAGVYNTLAEAQTAVEGVKEAIRFLS